MLGKAVESVKNWTLDLYSTIVDGGYSSAKRKLKNSPLSGSFLYEPALRWYAAFDTTKALVWIAAVVAPIVIGGLISAPIVAAALLVISVGFLFFLNYEVKLIKNELEKIDAGIVDEEAGDSIEDAPAVQNDLIAEIDSVFDSHREYENNHDLLDPLSWDIEAGQPNSIVSEILPTLKQESRTDTLVSISRRLVSKIVGSSSQKKEGSLQAVKMLSLLQEMQRKHHFETLNSVIERYISIKQVAAESVAERSSRNLKGIIESIGAGSRSETLMSVSAALVTQMKSFSVQRKESILKTSAFIREIQVVTQKYQATGTYFDVAYYRNRISLRYNARQSRSRTFTIDDVSLQVASTNNNICSNTLTPVNEIFNWTFNVRSISDLSAYCQENLIKLLALFKQIENSGITVILNVCTQEPDISSDVLEDEQPSFQGFTYALENVVVDDNKIQPREFLAVTAPDNHSWTFSFVMTPSQNDTSLTVDGNSSIEERSVLTARQDPQNTSVWFLSLSGVGGCNPRATERALVSSERADMKAKLIQLTNSFNEFMADDLEDKAIINANQENIWDMLDTIEQEDREFSLALQSIRAPKNQRVSPIKLIDNEGCSSSLTVNPKQEQSLLPTEESVFTWTLHVRSINDLKTFCELNLTKLLFLFKQIEEKGLRVICKVSHCNSSVHADQIVMPEPGQKSLSKTIKSIADVDSSGLIVSNVQTKKEATNHKWKLMFDFYSGASLLSASGSTKTILEGSCDEADPLSWQLSLKKPNSLALGSVHNEPEPSLVGVNAGISTSANSDSNEQKEDGLSLVEAIESSPTANLGLSSVSQRLRMLLDEEDDEVYEDDEEAVDEEDDNNTLSRLSKMSATLSALVNEDDDYQEIIANRESVAARQEREEQEDLEHEEFMRSYFNKTSTV